MAYDNTNGVSNVLTIQGFDGTQNLVASATINTLAGFDFMEEPVTLVSDANNIKVVKIISMPQLGDAFGHISFTVVPEPSTLTLLALGAIGLGLAVMRRRRVFFGTNSCAEFPDIQASEPQHCLFLCPV